MGEENIINQSQTPEDSKSNYLQWLKEQDPRILLGIVVSIIMILVVGFIFFIKETELLNDQKQPTESGFDFSEEEKMDILKSLGSDSSSDLSSKEKHGGLDNLSVDPTTNPQLREFEKLEALERLSQ